MSAHFLTLLKPDKHKYYWLTHIIPDERIHSGFHEQFAYRQHAAPGCVVQRGLSILKWREEDVHVLNCMIEIYEQK